MSKSAEMGHSVRYSYITWGATVEESRSVKVMFQLERTPPIYGDLVLQHKRSR